MPINEKTPRPQEFAAVDLGSNSFHMVIARVVDGAMQIIGRLKQRVHLADGLDENSVLSEEAIARGLNCLSLFAERLQGFSPSSVCIVGTHTLRQAANAAEFLKRAEKVIPYPIEIISGNEEARLIFMGVEHTQPERGRKLVIDIGGGSTELVIGEDFEPRLVESRRMGCVSFSQIYFPGGAINKENFQRARLSAVQKLETLAWQFRIQGWNVALGASSPHTRCASRRRVRRCGCARCGMTSAACVGALNSASAVTNSRQMLRMLGPQPYAHQAAQHDGCAAQRHYVDDLPLCAAI